SRGIDMAGAFPKPLTDDVVRAADYVITMGCGDACPVYPGKNYLDWDLADPAGQGPEVANQIVDDIDERVRAWWATVQRSEERRVGNGGGCGGGRRHESS